MQTYGIESRPMEVSIEQTSGIEGRLIESESKLLEVSADFQKLEQTYLGWSAENVCL